MKRRAWIYAALAVAVVAAAAVIGGRIRAVRLAAADPAGLVIAAVERADLAETVSGSGTVVAAANRPVTAQVTGTVSAVLAAAGDTVAAGRPVVRLENPDLLDQLAAARLDAELAELKWLDAVAPGDSEVASARRRVEAARLAVANRQADVDGLRVAAPAAGVVTGVQAAAGAEVRAGEVLLTLLLDGPLRVTADVPAAQAPYLAPGLAAEVAVHGLGTAGGRVVAVGAEARTAGGARATVPVTLELDPLPGARPGMTAAVRISVAGPAFTGTVEGGGALSPPDRIPVTARAAGQVTRVAAAEGDRVAAGALLVELESAALRNQLAQAGHDLADAEAALEGALAPLADNRGRMSARSLELQLEKARLTLATRERDAAHLEVRAPSEGVLVDPPEVGQRVAAGSLLFRISRQDPLEVIVDVDELDIARVQPGMAATVTVDALPNRTFAGAVTAIAPEGKARDGVTYFEVRVTVAEPGPLRPGMTAHADIPVDLRRGVLVVPAQALSEEQGRTLVRRIGADGAITAVPVEVGLHAGLQAEIRSGLAAGDRIVVTTIQPNLDALDPGRRSPFGGGGR